MPHGVSGKDKGTQLLRKSRNVSYIWQLNKKVQLIGLSTHDLLCSHFLVNFLGSERNSLDIFIYS